MARFKAGQESNYGGGGGTGFFSISNDKETKQVRFMYNGIDDVEGFAVHEVELDGKRRYVNCLREYNDPVDKCPFCKKGMPVMAKLFIPIYNLDEDQVQVWDRGKTMFSKMSSICSHNSGGSKGHLVNHIFEIERNGKPKDTRTTYEIYEIEQDDVELEDLPKPMNIVGGLVLDKTAEDMEYFLQEGQFPPTDNDGGEDEQPVRRRDTGRRTPTRRNSDAF